MNRILVLLSPFLFFIGCVQKNELNESIKTSTKSSLHFKITDTLGCKLINITAPFVGSNVEESYILYNRNSPKPEIDATHFIKVPLETVAINSTTHAGYLNELNKISTVTAATNTNIYYNEFFNKRIQSNLVSSLGNRNVSFEKLVDINPDIFFSYAIDAAAYKEVQNLRALGQRVILISEYMEQNPLDKARWLKFFAAFFGKESEKKADSILNKVTSNYNEIAAKAKIFEEKPTVCIGYPWKGTWYVSGAKSYQAQLIKDAGGNYVWDRPQYESEASVPLSFETAFNSSLTADIWINPGSKLSKQIMLDDFDEFRKVKSFKNDQVYTNYLKSNEYGANDYWESAVVRPDLLLNDLFQIFHKQSEVSHLNYYKKLDKE